MSQPGLPDPPLRRRNIVLQAAAMWLATRIGLASLTYVTIILNGYGNHRIPPGFVTGNFGLYTFVRSWEQWDAGFFIDISQKAYASPPYAAFFPLYPILIRALGTVTGQRHLLVIALIISNLAALVGFIGVALLATRENGVLAGPAAVRALAAYPLAFFLMAGYSDALLLAGASFTLLWAREGRWTRTAIAAFFTALTRSSALILFLPIVWEYGRQHGWWQTARWRSFEPRRLLSLRGWVDAVMVFAALPLAFGLFALYLWRRFGDPLLFSAPMRSTGTGTPSRSGSRSATRWLNWCGRRSGHIGTS